MDGALISFIRTAHLHSYRVRELYKCSGVVRLSLLDSMIYIKFL